MSAAVLCAVLGPAEARVVQSLALAGDAVTVARRCPDLAELLGSAAAGLGVVAVLSAELPHLDREAVAHLHDVGVWVVVLADERAGWSSDRAEALGADAVVETLHAERSVLRVVTDLLASAQAGSRPGQGVRPAPVAQRAGRADAGEADRAGGVLHSRSVGPGPRPPDRAGEHPARPGPGPGDTRPTDGPQAGRGLARGHSGARRDGTPPRPARGTLITVWGPTGAPGRTTVAVNLAAELAEQDALLVDADTYGGTVAQMLGLLDEAPGVAAAARLAATGRLDAAALAALTPRLEGGLRVLTGISRAHRWPEVTAANLEAVWAVARRLAAVTVVDCGFSIEQDELLSYDTRAPHRNAATLSALTEADHVVVVGAGDPIGLQRLVRALAELTDLGVQAQRHVVVNRVRASASGPRPAEAITDALRRYAGVNGALLVPEDQLGCDTAVLGGRTLREQVPHSPARRALVALAGEFAPARATAGAH